MAVLFSNNHGGNMAELIAPTGLSTTAFSVAWWFYATSFAATTSPYHAMVSRKVGTTTAPGVSTHNAGSGEKISLGDWNTDVHGVTTLATATWYFATWTRSGTTHRLYLNGVQEASGALQTPGNTLWFGDYYEMGVSTTPWLGRIANIMAANEEWTASQILAQMHILRPLWPVWAWYPLWPGATDRLVDHSGNGRTLTQSVSGTGSISDADNPPISWGAPIYVVPWVGSGGDESKSVGDSGGGVDAVAQVRVSVGTADGGAGNETVGGAAALGLGDGGAGADVLAQVLAALGLAESAVGSDVLARVAASVGLIESASGVDALAQVGALLGLAESGSSADVIAQLLAAVPTADTGVGADAVAGIAALVGVGDVGSGEDAPLVTVTLAIADIGTGLEQIFGYVLHAISDAGAGGDSLAGVTIALGVTDTCSGADSPAVMVGIEIADLGASVDALLAYVLQSIADAGTGSDAVAGVSAGVVVADSGAATGGRTLTNGANSWATIASGQVAGDMPAPLRLEITNTAGASRIYDSLWLALNVENDPANFGFFVEGESASGGSSSSNGNCSGGAARSLTVNTAASLVFTLSAANMQRARGAPFVLLGRFQSLSGAGVSVRPELHVSGVPVWRAIEPWVLNRLTPHISMLGVLPLPPQVWRAASNAAIQLVLSFQAPASRTVLLDYIALFPALDHRLLSLPGTAMANGDTIADNGIEGWLGVRASGVVSPVVLPRRPPLAVHPNTTQRIYLLHSTTTDCIVSDTVSLRAWYRPRRRTV